MKILFMSPDYHCSFIYADKLREMGHKCKIFVPEDYPINLPIAVEILSFLNQIIDFKISMENKMHIEIFSI